MNKIGPNKPCSCGSGRKFKKCCGPRGGLTKMQYDEEQAYIEDRDREYMLKCVRDKRKDFMLPMIPMLGMFEDGPGPAPPPPRKRGRGGKGYV